MANAQQFRPSEPYDKLIGRVRLEVEQGDGLDRIRRMAGADLDLLVLHGDFEPAAHLVCH